MRALLFVSTLLILSLVGANVLSVSAAFTDGQRKELMRSLRTIDMHLDQSYTRGYYSRKIYDWESILEEIDDMIERAYDSDEREELTRTLNLMKRLPEASKTCTKEALELLKEFTQICESSYVDLPELSGYFWKFYDTHGWACPQSKMEKA